MTGRIRGLAEMILAGGVSMTPDTPDLMAVAARLEALAERLADLSIRCGRSSRARRWKPGTSW